MPFQEMSAMEQRRELIRLAQQEGSNKRELFRRFGISPTTGYKWLARAAQGDGDLAARSRRPCHSPSKSTPEREQAVLEVRDAHPAWGARKIAVVLKRNGQTPPSISTIHAILRRHGRVEPRRGGGGAHRRFERAAPNELWQMDFKGWFRLTNGQNCYPLTLLDDHARYLLCLAACADQKEATVRGHLSAAFALYGLPMAIYVDNGPPWSDATGEHWTRLQVWLLKLGVKLIRGRPYHPQGRGKIERLHRSLDAEVINLVILRDLDAAQRAFNTWRPIYNHDRPHEALGDEVPGKRYKASPRRMPKELPEPSYQPGDILRRVGSTRASISFRGRLWQVGEAFSGETVAVRPLGTDGCHGIYFGGNEIRQIHLTEP
jgi:transposase InsO family protein